MSAALRNPVEEAAFLLHAQLTAQADRHQARAVSLRHCGHARMAALFEEVADGLCHLATEVLANA